MSKKSRIFVAALLLAGCASDPVQREFTAEERVRYDNESGVRLAEIFQSQLKIKDDVEVGVYLRTLTQTLIETMPDLRDSPVGAFVIEDTRSGRWVNYGLPGVRIYVSAGFLRKIDFENELAAAIALELAHISKRHALNRYEEMQDKQARSSPQLLDTVFPGPLHDAQALEFYGERGIFSYTDAQLDETVKEAVGILYRAGYDPRGMSTLCGNYKKNGKQSPYSEIQLARFTEIAHRTSVGFAPLRNPIVRSEAFLQVQKRMRQL